MITIRYAEMLEMLKRRVLEYEGPSERIVGAVRPRVKRLSRGAIAKETGISEKTLTKLKRAPDKDISFDTLNKLVQYFYREFLRTPPMGQNEETLFEWVSTNLIEVLPDSGEFWQTLNTSDKEWMHKENVRAYGLWRRLNENSKIPLKTELLNEYARVRKTQRGKGTIKR